MERPGSGGAALGECSRQLSDQSGKRHIEGGIQCASIQETARLHMSRRWGVFNGWMGQGQTSSLSREESSRVLVKPREIRAFAKWRVYLDAVSESHFQNSFIGRSFFNVQPFCTSVGFLRQHCHSAR